jgi:hypothetical protein
MRRVHCTYSILLGVLLGGVDVKWSGDLLVLICTDVIVVRVKVSRGFAIPQWGSTVRSLDDSPMGRFAWTNHIYFQITQPGSSTVTPLYQ